MYSYIDVDAIKVDAKSLLGIESCSKHYFNHEFDLLGSGYVKIFYGMKATGAFGVKYNSKIDYLLKEISKFRLKKICSREYEPINWFIDYKSGYTFDPFRYRTKKTCESAAGCYKGVEIKCPWELGRMYHLVQLAILALKVSKYREEVLKEYKNEFFDFCVMNPVGVGIQWSAPMDIAIRIVNLTVSHDVLKQLDSNNEFDSHFEKKFEYLIRQSLHYLMDNLEYYRRDSSNHYLSNLVGIIFAAAYLSRDAWSDSCLVFGVQELIDQVRLQFFEEGSHFEGSTSYHRLSAEFVIYATALIYGVLKTERKSAFEKTNSKMIKRLKPVKYQKYVLRNSVFFPKWYLDRILNMGLFTAAITKQNGEVVQVGDNDSGRLIKLTIMQKKGEGDDYDNVIDHRSLLSAIGGLTGNESFNTYTQKYPLEASVIKSITGGIITGGTPFQQSVVFSDSHINYSKYVYRKETVICDGKSNLLKGLKIIYFEKFGIAIIRGDNLFLCMVVDTTKHIHLLGHTHNDKLSLELMIDGKYILRDPGGYVYTASSKVRDEFRSNALHNTVNVRGMEQNLFDGVFGIRKRARSKLLKSEPERLIAIANYSDVEHIRDVEIKDDKVIVRDYANRKFWVNFNYAVYSVGYGRLKKRRRK